MTEPIVYEVPHPDSLTFAELDEVMALTGVDIAAERDSAQVMGRVLAALVCWSRHRAGEQVNYDTVYRTMRGNQIRITHVDPTQGAAP